MAYAARCCPIGAADTTTDDLHHDAVVVVVPSVVVGVVRTFASRRTGRDCWSRQGFLVRLENGVAPVLVISPVDNAVVMGSPLRLPARAGRKAIRQGRHGRWTSRTVRWWSCPDVSSGAPAP